MSEAPEHNWLREIWAKMPDECDVNGMYQFSAEATIARFEGDEDEYQKYVDADILESSEKYYKHQLEAVVAERDALHESLVQLRERMVLYCGGETAPFCGHTDKALLEQSKKALKTPEARDG